MSIYHLLINLIAKDKATPTLKRTGEAVRDLDTRLKGLSNIGEVLGVAGFLYAAKQAAGMAFELGKLGAESMRLESAFEDLAEQAGGSADDILAALKRATSGTVSEMDLIATANRGILLGLGAQADQWEDLAEVARFRARAMGISMTQAMNDITTAIGRESKMIADNLGIIWDMDKIMTNYAATLGKTADKMTSAERKAALMFDTIQQGQAQIAAAGGIEDDAVDSIERMNVAVAELKEAIGKELAPAIAWLAEEMTKLIRMASPDTATDKMVAFGQAALDAGGSYEEAAIAFNRATRVGILPTSEQFIEAMRRIGATDGIIASVADTLGYRLPEGFLKIKSSMVVLGALPGMFQSVADAADDAAGSMASLNNMVGMFNALTATTSGLPTFIWEKLPKEAQYALEVYQRESRNIWEDFISDGVRAWMGIGDAAEDSAKTAQSAYNDLASTITAALTPTSVTAFDMAMTEAGTYEDKWDEEARQLDAIAARGFAELEAHPDWIGMLEIPQWVLDSTEDVLKGWADQQSQNFRNLFVPFDEQDIQSAADRVREYMEQQAIREQNIDLIIQALGGGAAAEQAARELLGDTGVQGETAADKFLEGFKTEMGDAGLVTEFISYFKGDINDEKDNLKTTGELLWVRTEAGILSAMDEGLFVDHWVQILVGPLYAELQRRWTWGGDTGGQQP